MTQADFNALAVGASYIPLYNRYSKPPDGWEDWDFELFFEFTIPPNAPLNDQPLAIPPDADFYWRGIITTQLNSSGGDVKIQFRDSFGNTLQGPQALSAVNIGPFQENVGGIDGGALSAPMFPEVYCPRNSFLWLNMQEYLGATCQQQFYLVGVQRRPSQKAA